MDHYKLEMTIFLKIKLHTYSLGISGCLSIFLIITIAAVPEYKQQKADLSFLVSHTERGQCDLMWAGPSKKGPHNHVDLWKLQDFLHKTTI